MISDIDAFLKYFDGVNRRAVRDVSALPTDAETWKPPTGDGESAWDIGQIVAHMAASRLYFGAAYIGEGWVAEPWAGSTRTMDEWVAALNGSAQELRRRLEGSPEDLLTRRVDSLDTPGLTFSAWRLLMMMVEHDVHHRSQIEAYAGIMGWPVEHIFGRSAEQVGLQARRREKKG